MLEARWLEDLRSPSTSTRCAEWVASPALVSRRSRASLAGVGAEREHPAERAGAAAGARARRGALHDRHARALPAAARAGRDGERARRAAIVHGRGLDAPTTRSPTREHGRELLRLIDAGKPIDTERGRASRSSAATARRRSPRRRRGAADRRRAVEHVDRVRRRAHPEGLPPARGRGSTPSSRCCASSTAHGFPNIAAALRLVRVRRPLARRHARHRAAVRPGRASTAGSWRSTSSAPTPERLPRARVGGARRGDRRRCTRCSPPTPATRPSRPRSRATSRCRCSPRRSTRRSSGCSTRLPDDAARSRRSPAGAGRPRAPAASSRSSASGGRVIRIHGDYHLGQTLLTPAAAG